MPGTQPSAVIAIDRLAVDPVGTPEPRVVEKTGPGEDMVADAGFGSGLLGGRFPRRGLM